MRENVIKPINVAICRNIDSLLDEKHVRKVYSAPRTWSRTPIQGLLCSQLHGCSFQECSRHCADYQLALDLTRERPTVQENKIPVVQPSRKKNYLGQILLRRKHH